MKKALAVLTILGVAAVASAELNMQVYVASADEVAIQGTFDPTVINHAPPEVSSYVYRAPMAPSPCVEAPCPGNVFYVIATIDYAVESAVVRGFNLAVEACTPGTMIDQVLWYQFTAGSNLRWEASSVFEGECTLVGGLGGPGKGFTNLNTVWDTLSTTVETGDIDPDTYESINDSDMVLGAIILNPDSQECCFKVGLGPNGINAAGGVMVSLQGADPIDAGVGDYRWSECIGYIPEPASLLLLGLAGLVIRRR
jgi:hypothetical protein